ncbi:MAG: hypothetical protein WB424_02935 [Terracidiphilus sp.]
MLFVYRNIHEIICIESVIALLIAVRYGYIAATESDSPRKGKARLIGTFVFGSWLCIGSLSMILFNASLPVFDFEGRIESVQVIHSASRNYRASLQIQTTSGGNILIFASDRSQNFHPGEYVKVHYQGDTGELLKASFFAPNGKQDGAFISSSIWTPYLGFLFGMFIIWAGFRKYHRDPEAAEDSSWSNPSLLDSVEDDAEGKPLSSE